MAVVNALVFFGLRQFLGDGIQHVIGSVADQFRDHSQALPRAVDAANERSWKALAIALAGDGFFDQIKLLWAGGDDRALREQVRPLLAHSAAHFDQTPAAFRKACLAELRCAREAGLLSTDSISAEEIGWQVVQFPFAANPQALINGSARAMARLSGDLAPHCPNLSELLRRPSSSGAPLLVAAFSFFLRRQVETHDELARGLTFEGLRHLSATQEQAFGELDRALGELGDRFDLVLGQLGRIEAVAAATHATVLDLRQELGRAAKGQAEAADEVRRLIKDVLAQLARAGLQADEAIVTKAALAPRRRREPIRTALGMTFVWVPPGTLLAGSPPEETHRRDDEPQHAVTLTRGLYLAAHPVTQAQWRAVMGNVPALFPGDTLPVEKVSWDDCQEFCERLSLQEGAEHRLPTEAEWEYACRAGTAGPFHTGSTLSTEQANYDGREAYGKGTTRPFRGATTPVGTFPANAWGLFDMHGNVWEWCSDWYGPYPASHTTDPTGPAEGDARVLRGGSWLNPPWYCRSAYRYWADPATRAGHIGFRVCFTPAS